MAQLKGTFAERVLAANKIRAEQAGNRPANLSAFYQGKNTPISTFFGTQYAPFSKKGSNIPVPNPGNYSPPISAADLASFGQAVNMPYQFDKISYGAPSKYTGPVPSAPIEDNVVIDGSNRLTIPIPFDEKGVPQGISGMAAGIDPYGPSGAYASDSAYTLRDQANPAATAAPGQFVPAAQPSMWDRFKAAQASQQAPTISDRKMFPGY